MASSSRAQSNVGEAGEIFTTCESESDSDDESYVEGDSSDDSDDISDDEGDEETQEQPPRPKRPRPTARPRQRQPRRDPGVNARPWTDSDFDPTLFDFDNSNSGINADLEITEDISEIEVFRLFFTPAVMEHLVNETNRFYDFVIAHSVVKPNSRLHKWKPTTVEEMYVFLGVYMLMSHQKKMKMADYWSKDSLIQTPIFGHLMSSDRFFLLLRLIHFSNNENQVQGDRLSKIRPLMEMILDNFHYVLSPSKDVCIDESLMLWKGRLAFKQYIPSKRHRFGLKLFVICDVLTGYVLDFLVYTGSTTEYTTSTDAPLGVSGAVVMTLIAPYLDKGHTLFVDNWYTSPTLFEKLFEHQTGACGTVKPNRLGMPTFTEEMSRGDCANKHTAQLLAVKWCDKRNVMMLSTVHKNGMAGSGKVSRTTELEIQKPICILEYNKCMGSVDKSDMQISFVECARKTIKWYKKFFFHILDLAVLNSYIVFKAATGKKMQHSEYRLEMIRQIMQSYHIAKQNPKGGRPTAADNPLRLTEKHFPSFVPETPKKKNPTRYCTVCSNSTRRDKKRKESRYMCSVCDVGLCVVSCFQDYHTLLHF